MSDSIPKSSVPLTGTSAANESASDQSNPPPTHAQSNDLEAAPAPPQANPPETLTLALPSVEDDGKDQYAVVSFPATYKVLRPSSSTGTHFICGMIRE